MTPTEASDRSAASFGRRLLEQLEAQVRSDRSPNQLRGLVCMAVRDASGVHVWHAMFDRGLLGCGMLAGLPPDADAVLVLDEAGNGARIFGDTKLLEDFVSRFSGPLSPLALRAIGGR